MLHVGVRHSPNRRNWRMPHPSNSFRLALILAIMSVSTIITAFILHLLLSTASYSVCLMDNIYIQKASKYITCYSIHIKLHGNLFLTMNEIKTLINIMLKIFSKSVTYFPGFLASSIKPLIICLKQ